MTAYDFSLVKNTSIDFDVDADTINMGAVDASDFTITSVDGDLTLTNGDGDSVTLNSVSLAELSTVNILFGTGTTAGSSAAIFVGDNDSSALVDGIANTIDEATEKAAAEDANNLFYGMGGADVITANDGDNIIFGGSGAVDSADGADDITVGTGSNTIYGNAGNDNITIGATAAGNSVVVFGGLGNDSVDTGAGVASATLEVRGSSGNDTVDAGAWLGDATIYGGNGAGDSTDGADSISFGDGSAKIYGNAGNDTIDVDDTAANETVEIYGGLGNDDIETDVGVATATAKLFGNTGNDSIDADAFLGDVTIYGGNGVADSTDGSDVIDVGIGSTIVYANAGDDTINLGTYNADTEITVYTGLGDDVVSISGGDDEATTTINLASGAQTVDFDAVQGQLVTINNFDADNDTINWDLDSGDATDLVYANGFIFNDADSDGIYDAADEESINLASLASDLNGDNLVLTNAGIGGAVVGILATNLFGAADTLEGGTGNDQLIGGNSGDTFVVGAGDDKMVGGTGADVFQVEADELDNNDTIEGDTGTDTIELTAAGNLADNDFTEVTGVETLLFADEDFGGNTVTLNTEADEAGITTIDAGDLTGTNDVNVVLGGAFDNDITFTGGEGDDTMDGSGSNGAAINANGGDGDDQLFGDDAADTLTGGAGDDDLWGADEVDVITGGAGNDTISGGEGAESLSGGADDDTFVFAIGDSGDASATNAALVASLDTISDWATADDTLQFDDQGTEVFTAQSTTQAAINALNSGAGAATLLEAVNEALDGLDGSTNGQATSFQFGGATYVVYTMDDHSGGQDYSAAGDDILVKITGTHTLTAGDFTFV